jgi:hypothetical protein
MKPSVPTAVLLALAFVCVLPWCVDAADTETGTNGPASVERVNRKLGLPLWEGTNLWESSAAATASRLGARVESKTPKECTYNARPPLVFGVKPEVLKLAGKEGKVASLMIMYANKGDTLGLRPGVGRLVAEKDLRTAVKDFQKRDAALDKTIRGQADEIEDALVELFGKCDRTRFAQGLKTAEHVKAWRWNGHAFLLSEQHDAGLSLRIVPQDVIDEQRRVVRVQGADLKAALLKNVEARDNGDVVISGIPMIDQGQKGYCVPATWARYMRYMGMEVDEYALANAAGTKRGGGTAVEAMVVAAGAVARKNQRAIKEIAGPIKFSDIAKSIKSGLPLMWRMHAVGPFNGTGLSADRMGKRSAAEWKKDPALREMRRQAYRLAGDAENPHMCMIIGYNPDTEEVATSDSWGPAHAEKWYTFEEVMAVSAHKLYYIKW